MYRTPRDIDRRLTRKFKEIILNAPLIDTYALYRSIDVTIEIDMNFGTFMSAEYTYTVKIYAEEYLVYHIEPMNLIGSFVNSRSFSNTIGIFTENFKAYLTSEYPSLRFDNVTLQLNDVVVVNQPQGGNRSYDW